MPLRSPQRLHPLRLDPQRQRGLRRAFGAALRRRFRRLRGAVWSIIVVEDAFGLRLPPSGGPVVHTRWRFAQTADQVAAFRRWIKEQVRKGVLSPDAAAEYREFVEDGFRAGAARSYGDVAGRTGLGLEEGAREQFLRSAFRQPVAVEKIELLAARTFDELEGVTERMSRRMVRALTDGLVRGESPRDIARDLTNTVGLEEGRALTIARTEISRSHAEGQLTALEQLGVEELGVEVEWVVSGLGTTALGNPSPCEECAPMAGRTFTLDEARGLIPFHPNCLCVWAPAVPGT